MNERFAISDELNICGISVLSGARQRGRTVSWERTGRKNNGFLFIRSGEVTFYCRDGQTVHAADGDLVFLPKGFAYRMAYGGQVTSFVLVNFELLDKNGNDVSFDDRISVTANDGGSQRIAGVMLKFGQCGASRNHAAVLRRKELCYRIFGLLSDAFFMTSEGKEILPQIAEGVRLLMQTYPETRPIADYATASHISVNRFRELFRKQFGVSPVKFRNQLRIERAKELLMDGDLTVSEIAYASGFENLGYFYRQYLTWIGETPTDTKRKSGK